MKTRNQIQTLLLFFSVIFYASTSVAQQQATNEMGEVFQSVEVMPMINTCATRVMNETEKQECTTKEVLNMISKTITYPENAKSNQVQGTVYVSFIIEKDGSLSGAKVLRGVNEELDAEAARAIMATNGKWIPGTQKGKAVRVQYTVPIKFSLS